MPYTPPHQSPSASPASSRTASISILDPTTTASLSSSVLFSSSNPPRSATYLHKTRRASSIVAVNGPNKHAGGRATSTVPIRTAAQQGFFDPRSGGSIHQSPPPVDNGLSLIPAGAIISPPDSPQNSSDDEESTGENSRRGRSLDSNLEQQLQEAIKNIPQRRQPSPESSMPRKTPSPIDTNLASRRAPHHQRSTSEFSFLQDLHSPKQDSNSGSDAEDDGYRIAPPMVRKKSGELVKSSLKTPNRSRPCSMPSTPTFPKVVHFDSEIEHVRHFNHAEKPSAVSAGSSPVASFDGETEYPFEDAYHPREPSIEWEISLPNFPKDLDARKSLPVRVERVYLSNDSKNLCGTVAVANISFQKAVVVRFTLDYWQTTSEVSAEFTNDVRRRHREDGIDRFAFTIRLADQANLENKILFFCVRYSVNGQDHWDSNNGFNFQVDFKKKKSKSNTANVGSQRLSGLPRSRPSPTAIRPRSMPNFDDLGSYNPMFFDNNRAVDSGDDEPVVLRPKSKISTTSEDDLSARRANPSGNAFGNRYDFSASLTAAIKASNHVVGSKRNVLEKKTGVSSEKKLEDSPQFKFGGGASETSVKRSSVDASRNLSVVIPDKPSLTPLESPSNTGAGPPEIFRPDVFVADKPSIESTSYRELLDNYCFFGSSKTTPFSAQNEIAEKKSLEAITSKTTLISAAAFRAGSPITESPAFLASPPNGSPPSLSGSLRSSGNVSPIPMNYAGFRHSRRPSGAFRFEPPHAPTAIC
ncbi:hypothetical protein RUND412_008612 [Rhizina undulata]